MLDAAPDPRSTSEAAARRGQDDPAACGAATVVTAAEIERARSVIDGRAHVTPIFTSRLLSEAAGAPVVLKAELFQRTGSFKLRGVLTRLARLSSAERQRGVITVSAGNHAQALAYGCAEEGIDCLVVMWRGATNAKAAAVRACGASINLESADPTEAFGRMETIQRQSGRLPIHPFSDPLVVAGQGTVGLEIAEQVPNVATVLVPTGGGGLVSGVAVALRARSPSARVVAVEPQDAAALALGLEAGRPVPLMPVTHADGLAAPYTSDLCIELCRSCRVGTVRVTEDEIREGMRFLYGRAKLACEPAGAAGVGALLAGKIARPSAGTIVAVVSGGNVDAHVASATLAGDEG